MASWFLLAVTATVVTQNGPKRTLELARPANFKGKRVKNSYELRAEMEWPF